MRVRRGIEGPTSRAVTWTWPAHMDPRIALDTRHAGYGCRMDRGCPFLATIAERAEHELVHGPDERGSR